MQAIFKGMDRLRGAQKSSFMVTLAEVSSGECSRSNLPSICYYTESTSVATIAPIRHRAPSMWEG